MFIAQHGVELANRGQKVPVNRSVSCTTIDIERIGPAMAEKSSEMKVSEVCETKGVTVHQVIVGELSPVKESRGKVGVKYFEGQLSDGKKTVMVSFEPNL